MRHERSDRSHPPRVCPASAIAVDDHEQQDEALANSRRKSRLWVQQQRWPHAGVRLEGGIVAQRFDRLPVLGLALLGRATAIVAALLLIGGCAQAAYDSPIVNQDGPVIDIATLPDIEQATTETLDLIERIRTEVTRLVPAAAPWKWYRQQSGHSCVQEETGRKGVSRILRSLVSEHSFTDREWELVLPAVRQLADEAGLTGVTAPQNGPGSRDMRFSSDDGRTLMFGSRGASVITGRIACRRPAESPAP